MNTKALLRVLRDQLEINASFDDQDIFVTKVEESSNHSKLYVTIPVEGFNRCFEVLAKELPSLERASQK